MLNIFLAYADSGSTQLSAIYNFLPIFLVFVVMYFLIIRPQQKRVREHQSFTENLSVGDTVLTKGGVIGNISDIKDDVILLQIEQGASFKILRSALERAYIVHVSDSKNILTNAGKQKRSKGKSKST